MPISRSKYYQERVFTSTIGSEIDDDKGLTDAAHHVVDYGDPGALSWMADRLRDRVEAIADLSDDELQGTIEWYLQRGSSKSYTR